MKSGLVVYEAKNVSFTLANTKHISLIVQLKMMESFTTNKIHRPTRNRNKLQNMRKWW